MEAGMTTDELRKRLISMAAEERTDFARGISAGDFSDERIVEMYRDGPWEARICDYLKVPTQAGEVARNQHLFNILISIVSLLALLVAVMAYLK
jgi:hypothetical protein